jgi:hypothetical protein
MIDVWLNLTIGMPDLAEKLHFGRIERIVFWKLELRGEYASLEGCVFGSLDQGFPGEDVVFCYWAGGYAVRWGGGEETVFVEEAFGCYSRGHGWGILLAGWVMFEMEEDCRR